jgi:hypothetical protein
MSRAWSLCPTVFVFCYFLYVSIAILIKDLVTQGDMEMDNDTKFDDEIRFASSPRIKIDDGANPDSCNRERLRMIRNRLWKWSIDKPNQSLADSWRYQQTLIDLDAHTHTHTHTHTDTHTHTHTHTHRARHTRPHTPTRAHTHTETHTHTHTQTDTHTHRHTHTHRDTHAHTHTDTDTHVHVYVHVLCSLLTCTID